MYFLAKDLGMDTRLRQRAVIINKVSYPHNMLNRMPDPELTMEKATTAYSEDGIMFRSNHHKLSNLYPCEIEDDGIHYSSVEQAFQCGKARMCGDKKAESRIKGMSCPYDMMSEGKKVRETANWAKMAENYLYRLNCQKFEKEDMKEYLQNTGEYHLYEASFHPVWGCGYHLGQADVCRVDTLKGENIHGKILTRIRKNQRRAEESQEQEEIDQNNDG